MIILNKEYSMQPQTSYLSGILSIENDKHRKYVSAANNHRTTSNEHETRICITSFILVYFLLSNDIKYM